MAPKKRPRWRLKGKHPAGDLWRSYSSRKQAGIAKGVILTHTHTHKNVVLNKESFGVFFLFPNLFCFGKLWFTMVVFLLCSVSIMIKVQNTHHQWLQKMLWWVPEAAKVASKEAKAGCAMMKSLGKEWWETGCFPWVTRRAMLHLYVLVCQIISYHIISWNYGKNWYTLAYNQTMVYPFVIPFDVALLLSVFLQWHTITIKECHGHFSCRWIVLQSLAQSSRSAQKKHRHHNSFGVHAWQNSNHLGWIELTQFMGFWIICRYFLTMWPILYHIHWLLSRSRIHLSILAAGHAPKEVAPNCCNLCRRGTGVRASQAAQVPKRSAGKVWDWCRFFYTHKKRPQSGEKRTPSITSIIQFPTRLTVQCWTRGDKIGDWQILHWELHSHWLFAVCRFFNISVVATGEWRRWCFTARTDWKDSTALLQWSPHVSIFSGWVQL